MTEPQWTETGNGEWPLWGKHSKHPRYFHKYYPIVQKIARYKGPKHIPARMWRIDEGIDLAGSPNMAIYTPFRCFIKNYNPGTTPGERFEGGEKHLILAEIDMDRILKQSFECWYYLEEKGLKYYFIAEDIRAAFRPNYYGSGWNVHKQPIEQGHQIAKFGPDAMLEMGLSTRHNLSDYENCRGEFFLNFLKKYYESGYF